MLRGTLAARPTLLASRTTSTGAIANTEAVVISATIPAGTLQAGDTFQIIAGGVHTNDTLSAVGTYQIRIGPTTLTGAIAAAGTLAYGAAPRTNVEFVLTASVTIRSTGASGTAIGALGTTFIVAANTNGAVTSAVTVDTTVANLIELTYSSGNAGSSETYTTASISKA